MIDVANVDVRLGGVSVLRDVSLSVDEGRLVGLVGPNGAGKTTLLRTINGVLDPDAGTVRVAGREVHALGSRAASRLIASVPQETAVAFEFSVRDVVEMGRTPHRPRLRRVDDGEHVKRALERTRTAGFAGRSIDAVSGGERSRVLLARALAQDTPVLLLDEPTASHDIANQVRTLDLVRGLVREGKTALAAIHDLDLAARFCDALVLLADGRVCAAGPPGEVLVPGTLAEAFGTRAVVAPNPVTGTPSVTALEDGAPAGAGRVHVIGGGATAARALATLVTAGFEVTAGALNEGDAALETARSLGIETVTEEAFAPVSDRARRATEERVRAADATVLADPAVTPGSLPNLAAADAGDALVAVEARPLEERIRAGERGRARYARLRERARVVDAARMDAAGTGDGDLLEAVREAVTAPTTAKRKAEADADD